jgi:hypothetical protein
MNFSSIRDARKRRRLMNRFRKGMVRRLRPEQQARGVFILGSQRSGTNMVYDYFENRNDTDAYNESDPVAFADYQLRPFAEIAPLLERARAPLAVFKPICDSHRFTEIRRTFPGAAYIWLLRHYKDVANSSIRHFRFSGRAIRLVCEGRTGGGWFQDGVSADSASILRDVYDPDLSDFELSCLVWWARNRIVIEQDVDEAPGTVLLAYEDLVTRPDRVFPFLCRGLGLPEQPRAHRHVHSRSIHRHAYPPLAARIEILCDGLSEELTRRLGANQRRIAG